MLHRRFITGPAILQLNEIQSVYASGGLSNAFHISGGIDIGGLPRIDYMTKGSECISG